MLQVSSVGAWDNISLGLKADGEITLADIQQREVKPTVDGKPRVYYQTVSVGTVTIFSGQDNIHQKSMVINLLSASVGFPFRAQSTIWMQSIADFLVVKLF